LSLTVIGLPACGADQSSGPAAQTTPAPTATTPPPAKPAKSKKLVRAEPLPKLARKLLESRMIRHGKQMQTLLWAAMLIDYQAAGRLARQIADEPRISRPDKSDLNSINHVFPPRFFDLQDELFSEAQSLAAAADSHNDMAMAVSYGKLSKTCVSCHALYLSFRVAKKH